MKHPSLPNAPEYPRPWLFKVIGVSGRAVRKAVAEVISKGEYRVSFSNISSKGNYTAFNVEMLVDSQEHRDEIYQNLKKHPQIKAVL